MDLTRFDFNRMSAEKNASSLQLAREFIQLEILRMISSSDLRRTISFKGGTALHLVFNMDRYSEDLDFSLSTPVPPRIILNTIRKILKDENITDFAIKKKTVLVEIRQQFRPQNFRVKLEINTEDIVPSELKTLYSEYVPTQFTMQIMRTDYLIAQKVRALIQRGKGRDLYDLWFILRTKLPINTAIVSELTGFKKSDVLGKLEESIINLGEKEIASDLNPFIKPSLRQWIREGLKKDVIQLLKSLNLHTTAK